MGKATQTNDAALSSPTMQDIAERLDISVATVSRALRRVKGINPNTRAKVLLAASELGYQLPQTMGQSNLKRTELKHVGVFIETSRDGTPPLYLSGMSEAAVQLDVSLTIHYLNPDECEKILDPRNQPSAMRAGLLSGAVLVFWWPSAVVEKLSQILPLVSIMHKYPGLNLDTVGIDNESGTFALVQHLRDLGHRNIAFFGRCGSIHWANSRFGAFVSALNALDLPYQPELVVDTPFEEISQFDAKLGPSAHHALDLFEQGKATAFLCVSETAGWLLHQMFTARGHRIPEDLSLTGFHRPSFRETSRPDLTSVGSPFEAVGAAALRRLLYRVQNPLEAPRTILLPCDFYQGASTAPSP